MWLVNHIFFGKPSYSETPVASKPSREFGLLKLAVSFLAVSSQFRPVRALNGTVIDFEDSEFSPHFEESLSIAGNPSFSFPSSTDLRLCPELHQIKFEYELNKKHPKLTQSPLDHIEKGDRLLKLFEETARSLFLSSESFLAAAAATTSELERYKAYVCGQKEAERLKAIRVWMCPQISTFLFTAWMPESKMSSLKRLEVINEKLHFLCVTPTFLSQSPGPEWTERLKKWERKALENACQEDPSLPDCKKLRSM